VSRNQLRIVGGQWRSRRLHFAAVPGLRPTPDAVRETLFNWLGQRLDGLRCLDLFAGSGALGFEAASRGAANVVMVEHDRAALAALRRNAELLQARQVELAADEASHFLGADRRRFDLIFFDPPYGRGWTERLLPALSEHLSEDGRIYLEQAETPSAWAGYTLVRQGKAGKVRYCLLEKS
jgi:16S rRNA (guanine(966)-N(2))-methyltransferase RsmD